MTTHAVKKSEVSAAKRAHGKKMWQRNRVPMAIGVLKSLPKEEREEAIRAVQCHSAGYKPTMKVPAKARKATMSPVKKSHKKH